MYTVHAHCFVATNSCRSSAPRGRSSGAAGHRSLEAHALQSHRIGPELAYGHERRRMLFPNPEPQSRNGERNSVGWPWWWCRGLAATQVRCPGRIRTHDQRVRVLCSIHPGPAHGHERRRMLFPNPELQLRNGERNPVGWPWWWCRGLAATQVRCPGGIRTDDHRVRSVVLYPRVRSADCVPGVRFDRNTGR